MNLALDIPAKTDYPPYIFSTAYGLESCASAYYETNFLIRRVFIQRMKETIKLIPPRSYKCILDAGTGIGFLLPTLSHLAQCVVAVDYSQILTTTMQMVKRRHLTNIYPCQADLTNLPFDANSFDLIICLSVLEHIPEPAEVLGEFRRVLKRDGVAIVGYPVENLALGMIRKIEGILFRPDQYRAAAASVGRHLISGHVTAGHSIATDAARLLKVEREVNIKLVGLAPLYQLLRLQIG
ncbi:MAG: class I SAM-dependent methyltransferase [Chloroflexi bacterium]|nr:class I SAM-dependent methyltransferase [Chloroflexota bacterium]MCL5075274.1 class I SAM-dependent methyltransferase [Chloroflexota bacterium]